MSDKCKEEVYDSVSRRFCQCSRNAVNDGYCSQHHPESVKARRAKADALYEAKRANNPYNLAIKRAEKAEHQRDTLLAVLKELLAEYELVMASEYSRDNDEYMKNARQLIAEIEGK